MSKQELAAALLYKSGGTRLLGYWWGAQRLTVLCYHSICDPYAPGYNNYEPNVSATPAMFARQMDYVKQHFNVIDLATLHAHVTNGAPLPPRPLLITFDDGYHDNYTNAYPVLRERGLPAVFFIVSGWMGSRQLPWWDQCGYLFRHTQQTHADLPLIGAQDLATPAARRTARETFIRQLKVSPEADKAEHMAALAVVLAVNVPEHSKPLFISWEQAREVIANGIACQPHTVSHPILTRLPLETAQEELRLSIERIAEETGQPITAFAYPNGTINDYNPGIMQQLRVLGVSLAFTLTPGPLRSAEVRNRALEIPRVFLGHRDTFEMFVAKVMGIPALLEQRQYHG